ncbi:MAG TPA: isoprenylcysteine carboxylmethyltransferase family protein [Candidatus Limnocylindrales bacterium]|nr:isoprenylcysteine carboxylmethyltransferase family protein [Candidatus Limnocylindrales bacterium]
MATNVLGALILLGWLSLEVILRASGSAASLSRTEADRYTTPLLVTGYGVAILLPIAFAVAGLDTVGDVAWLGVAVAGLALGLRAWAMRTLGALYTRTLRTAADQQLVTSGPYRWIRHPGYVASLGVWVGAALAFHSAIAAIAVAILLGVAYAWRIRNEERMLEASFGDAYRAYAARTARVLPGLL